MRLSWLVSGVTWMGAAFFALWAGWRLLGLERGYPGVQLMAFTPYVAVLALAAAVACVLLRRRAAAVLALAASLALGLAVAPRTISEDTEVKGVALRVLSVNLLLGEADAVEIVELVRRTRPDVVAFQEFTNGAARRLEEAGLRTILPNMSLHPVDGSHGSAIYSRLPVSSAGVREHGSGFAQAKAELTLDGVGTVAVESVHPCAPTGPERDDCWFAEIADQPMPRGDGPPQLLIGDFNATLDHAPLRQLLDTGYRDVGEQLGEGLKPTWPSDRWPPGVTIDHVLIGPRIGARSYEVLPIAGSDHRAVFAELVVAVSG